MPGVDYINLTDNALEHSKSVSGRFAAFSASPYATRGFVKCFGCHARTIKFIDADKHCRFSNGDGLGSILEFQFAQRNPAKLEALISPHFVRERLTRPEGVNHGSFNAEGGFFVRNAMREYINARLKTGSFQFGDAADLG